MLQPAQAVEVAETFDLGGHAVLTGPVAAGRLGDVWRLSSERGDYAVKDARFPVDPAEVAADAADPAGELGVVLFAFGLGDPGRMRDCSRRTSPPAGRPASRRPETSPC